MVLRQFIWDAIDCVRCDAFNGIPGVWVQYAVLTDTKKLLFLLFYFAEYYNIGNALFLSDSAYDAEWIEKIGETFP